MQKIQFVLALITLTLSGCELIPPFKVPEDRQAYLEALNTSWKEQLLYNLVLLRYGEAPTFIDIDSISAGYELGASTTGISPNSLINGAIQGDFSSKPSIQYKPLSGVTIKKILLEPIPLSDIFRAMETGWSPNFILPYCIQSVNYLTFTQSLNHYHSDINKKISETHKNESDLDKDIKQYLIDYRTKPPNKDFFTLSQIWQELFKRKAIHVTFENESKNTPEEKSGNLDIHKENAENNESEETSDKDKLVENLVTFTSKLVQKQNENIAADKKNNEAIFITLDDPNVSKGNSEDVFKYSFADVPKGNSEDDEEKSKRPFINESTKDLITRFKKQVGITKLECNRFKVVYGYPYYNQTQDNQASSKDKCPEIPEIYVHPDSVLRGLMRAAKFIQIPDKDKYKGAKPVSDKYVLPSKDALPRDLKQITIKAKKILLPADITYARVRYRDLWFYIDDRDIESKDMFSNLIGILTMLDTEKKADTILTLPVR
jgi:hypothetical protein